LHSPGTETEINGVALGRVLKNTGEYLQTFVQGVELRVWESQGSDSTQILRVKLGDHICVYEHNVAPLVQPARRPSGVGKTECERGNIVGSL